MREWREGWLLSTGLWGGVVPLGREGGWWLCREVWGRVRICAAEAEMYIAVNNYPSVNKLALGLRSSDHHAFAWYGWPILGGEYTWGRSNVKFLSTKAAQRRL